MQNKASTIVGTLALLIILGVGFAFLLSRNEDMLPLKTTSQPGILSSPTNPVTTSPDETSSESFVLTTDPSEKLTLQFPTDFRLSTTEDPTVAILESVASRDPADQNFLELTSYLSKDNTVETFEAAEKAEFTTPIERNRGYRYVPGYTAAKLGVWTTYFFANENQPDSYPHSAVVFTPSGYLRFAFDENRSTASTYPVTFNISTVGKIISSLQIDETQNSSSPAAGQIPWP